MSEADLFVFAAVFNSGIQSRSCTVDPQRRKSKMKINGIVCETVFFFFDSASFESDDVAVTVEFKRFSVLLRSN